MENTIRVAVDMEATLADTHRAMLRIYNARHGTSHSFDDIQWWDWVADVIDFDEFMRIVDMNWVQDPFSIPACDWTPPISDTLRRLDDVTTYDIVTARSGGWYEPLDSDAYDDVNDAMRDWLSARGVDSFHAFHAIQEHESKAPLGYDYYIDDNPNLAAELSDNQHQLIPRRPWNAETDVTALDNVTIVDSLAEAVTTIADDLS